ncbi:unnamed protein product [Rangifer tarandus platyrhynchus]|uniref:Uncharacterized protein n=2 Tax=Rangifer tarandus platyrhynchus TaxID=3082113 RepID=A0ABN8YB94_RANTA|nr:unnamed protein product [Rangifer tarandus platyrhynchus]
MLLNVCVFFKVKTTHKHDKRSNIKEGFKLERSPPLRHPLCPSVRESFRECLPLMQASCLQSCLDGIMSSQVKPGFFSYPDCSDIFTLSINIIVQFSLITCAMIFFQFSHFGGHFHCAL